MRRRHLRHLLRALAVGGIGVADNPVYEASVEAFEYTAAYRSADRQIVSLGTGSCRAASVRALGTAAVAG
jgi:hypothetical protein